jgi:trimethylamine---corrinoid protein Co-methyltransferase
VDKYVRARYRVNNSPVYRMLSEDQQKEIYQAALEILERTGAVIHDKESLELFEKAGCWVEGERVRFPAGYHRVGCKSSSVTDTHV